MEARVSSSQQVAVSLKARIRTAWYRSLLSMLEPNAVVYPKLEQRDAPRSFAEPTTCVGL